MDIATSIELLKIYNSLAPQDRSWFAAHMVLAGQLGWLDAYAQAGENRDDTIAAYAVAGTLRHPADTERLMEYWAHGEGAAKVRWPEPCAFCRCLEHLTKYYPKNPKGLCANLEKRATGHWPNPEHSRVHHCPC